MGIKAVLIDFDGTVVNSEKSRFGALNIVLGKYDIAIEEEEWNKNYKRWDSRKILSTFKENYSIEEDVETLYNEVFSKRSELIEKDGVEVTKGFQEFIEKLKENGIAYLICSGGNREHIKNTMEKAGLENLDFIAREDYKEAKPSPDCYFKGQEILGLKSGSTIVIDDSYNGLLAGIKAGCKSVIGMICSDEENIEELPMMSMVKDFSEISVEHFK